MRRFENEKPATNSSSRETEPKRIFEMERPAGNAFLTLEVEVLEERIAPAYQSYLKDFQFVAKFNKSSDPFVLTT